MSASQRHPASPASWHWRASQLQCQDWYSSHSPVVEQVGAHDVLGQRTAASSRTWSHEVAPDGRQMWTAGARLGMGQSVSSDERSNLISSFRTDARSFIPIAFNLDRRDLLSSTADLRGRTGSVADRALAHNRERTIYFLVASGPVFRRAPSLGAFRGGRLSKM